jgi:hypothetical protein
MEPKHEALHHQVKELLKQRKEENDALKKIIVAMERKHVRETKTIKENKPRS